MCVHVKGSTSHMRAQSGALGAGGVNWGERPGPTLGARIPGAEPPVFGFPDATHRAFRHAQLARQRGGQGGGRRKDLDFVAER